jgi:DNA-binding HxlR family transcriptional regulator
LTKSPTSNDSRSDNCSLVNAAWNDLSKVWTLPVIHTLGLYQPSRFNELKRRIAGISATSLTERLTELEERRIVARKVYPETPPKVEYSLTEKGWELHAILRELSDWVIKWENNDGLITAQIRQRSKQ